MSKFIFVVAALVLTLAISAANDPVPASDLKTATNAATHPLGIVLNATGLDGNPTNPNGLHPGGKGAPSDGVIEPVQDFSFSSQSEGSGSYAVTVNKKLFSF